MYSLSSVSFSSVYECSQQVEMGHSALNATRLVSHPEDVAAGSHSGTLSKKTAGETMFAAGVNRFPEAKGDSAV